jgi:hypothetical protein
MPGQPGNTSRESPAYLHRRPHGQQKKRHPGCAHGWRPPPRCKLDGKDKGEWRAFIKSRSLAYRLSRMPARRCSPRFARWPRSGPVWGSRAQTQCIERESRSKPRYLCHELVSKEEAKKWIKKKLTDVREPTKPRQLTQMMLRRPCSTVRQTAVKETPMAGPYGARGQNKRIHAQG